MRIFSYDSWVALLNIRDNILLQLKKKKMQNQTNKNVTNKSF